MAASYYCHVLAFTTKEKNKDEKSTDSRTAHDRLRALMTHLYHMLRYRLITACSYHAANMLWQDVAPYSVLCVQPAIRYEIFLKKY